MMKLFALRSEQGTACAETCLCEDHVGEVDAQYNAIRQADKDVPQDAQFEDCTGNEALSCIVCGESSIEWDD